MKRRHPRVVRAAVVALLGAMALGAAGAGCSSSEAGGKGSADALKAQTGVDWIVSTNKETGAVTFASPKNGPTSRRGAARPSTR